MKEIFVHELNLNPMTLIGGEWWLIAAGNEKDGYNTMTASWGHLGSIWERPGEGPLIQGCLPLLYICGRNDTRKK